MPGRPNRSPIIIDPSDSVVVITCRAHPFWSACRWTIDDALDVGVRHEAEQHPGERHVMQRRSQRNAYRRRHAAKHANPDT